MKLDATELINPHSRINGEVPEFVETEHFFLDLPALSQALGEWLRTRTDWRPNVLKFSLNLLEDVRHPDAVQQEIYRQMELNAKQQASWGAPQASREATIPEQIEQLAALRDKGHISAEEFESKKASLLERM